MSAIPHFALPLRLAGGTFATVEQDTVDDVAACVEAIVRYPRGHRTDVPEFGIDDPVFALDGADPEDLLDDVREWEPRADLLVEDLGNDGAEAFLQQVAITVRAARGN